MWWKRPEVIVAKYQTTDGQTRDNLLLVSGWWGIARHFHYIGERAGALTWMLPCRFEVFAPYLYVLYLTILLGHRSYRDDARCRAKYGVYWQAYCQRVAYRVIPGVF